MSDVFITLREAAAFEGITYQGMTSRVARNPKQYKTKTQAREGGGKDQVLISVASLTAKARKAYRATQKVDGRDVIIDQRTAKATPWYVDADLNHYIETNKKKFYGPRYQKAAPPREYAAMLLMKADTARVYNYGINKFGTVYTDSELGKYIGQKVGVKWDIDDVSKLYVYDNTGKKICEAVSAEVLAFAGHCSQAALEEHMKAQKKQKRDAEKLLEDYTTPYELRVEQGRPSDAVGKLDLTIKATRNPKLISLPNDKEYRAEATAASKKKRAAAGEEFLAAKADSALSRLRAINE